MQISAAMQPRRLCFVALTHPTQNGQTCDGDDLDSYEAEKALLRAGVKLAFGGNEL